MVSGIYAVAALLLTPLPLIDAVLEITGRHTRAGQALPRIPKLNVSRDMNAVLWATGHVVVCIFLAAGLYYSWGIENLLIVFPDLPYQVHAFRRIRTTLAAGRNGV